MADRRRVGVVFVVGAFPKARCGNRAHLHTLTFSTAALIASRVAPASLSCIAASTSSRNVRSVVSSALMAGGLHKSICQALADAIA